MENKNEIFNLIWKSCERFRGKIDSSKYKDYVLSMLFIKYLSDLYHYKVDEIKRTKPKPMWDSFIERIPYKLDDQCDFIYLVNNKEQENLGHLINQVVKRIESKNKSIQGTLELVDFNDRMLGDSTEKNKALKGLITTFENSQLDFSPDHTTTDILGDVYEYLIANFASDAGKKGGEFYTPSEVSTLVAKIVSPKKGDSIYDPTCGSGSLLIKTSKQLKDEKNKQIENFDLYGQEINAQTEVLARMNMILHNINGANIVRGNTLTNPLFKENENKVKQFDIIVANPPFSLNIEDDIEVIKNDIFHRYDFGIPPKNKGDFAFVQHMIASLKSKGKGVTVLPEGPLFRGGQEGKIRQSLLENNWIEGIIKLPSNLFFGTSISSILFIMNKDKKTNEVFFINASEEYKSNKNQNKLTSNNIDKIYHTWNKREEIDKFSRNVSFDEIKENDFSLNVSTYVDNSEIEEEYDLLELQDQI